MDLFAGAHIPRSPVYGMRGMVVSGHSLASVAGLRTLEAGGNVVDATIVTSAVLTVVLPHATALGGDAFILYHDAKAGRTVGLNASGPAPAGATPDRFPGGMVARGPLAASVPGIVRGWEALHRKHGKLPWKTLFDPAIDLAENGHPLSRVLSAGLDLFRDDVARDPGLSALYLPGGTKRNGGDIVRQPALARTLRTIAAEGSGAFYEGPIAAAIGDYSQKNGGLLSARDFAGYAPEWVEPLRTDYRGRTVQVMPPNSYGVLMLMQLNGLSALDPAELDADDARRLAYLMTAYRAAFGEGRRHIADPRTDPAPLDAMLGAETTARIQKAVRAVSAPAVPGGRGGTSCIALADGEGNAVCVVQSVFYVFGSAFMDPGTGILLNNRMMGFTHEPGQPNTVAPGKRPSHTLNPVIVLDRGKLRYLLSTPGGPSQTMSLVQILSNLVDRRMELSVAIEAPRWSVNTAGDILLEEEFPDAVAERLKSLGFPTGRASGASYFGSAKCLEVLPNGVLSGAADCRREAYAVGA